MRKSGDVDDTEEVAGIEAVQPQVPSTKPEQVGHRNGHGAVRPEPLLPAHQIHGDERKQQQAHPVQPMGQDERQTRHSASPMLVKIERHRDGGGLIGHHRSLAQRRLDPIPARLRAGTRPLDERFGELFDGALPPSEGFSLHVQRLALDHSGCHIPQASRHHVVELDLEDLRRGLVLVGPLVPQGNGELGELLDITLGQTDDVDFGIIELLPSELVQALNFRMVTVRVDLRLHLHELLHLWREGVPYGPY